MYSFNDERSSAGGSPPPVANSPLMAGANWRLGVQQRQQATLAFAKAAVAAASPCRQPRQPSVASVVESPEQESEADAASAELPDPGVVSALVAALNMMRSNHDELALRVATLTHERDFLQGQLRHEVTRRRRLEEELTDSRRNRRKRSPSPGPKRSPSPRPLANNRGRGQSPHTGRAVFRSRSGGGRSGGSGGGSGFARTTTTDDGQICGVLAALDAQLHSAPVIGLAIAEGEGAADEYIPGVNGTPPLRSAPQPEFERDGEEHPRTSPGATYEQKSPPNPRRASRSPRHGTASSAGCKPPRLCRTALLELSANQTAGNHGNVKLQRAVSKPSPRAGASRTNAQRAVTHHTFSPPRHVPLPHAPPPRLGPRRKRL
eukprot:Hpha_TRINITY_DN15188_c1_g16::TRINITY_DN15188_c1_g16_i2::g.128635::m.128635